MDAQNLWLDSTPALRGHVEPLSVRQLDPIPQGPRMPAVVDAELSWPLPGSRCEQGPLQVSGKGSPRQAAGRKARGPARRHVLCRLLCPLLPAWACAASRVLLSLWACVLPVRPRMPALGPLLGLCLLLASLSVSASSSISSTSCPPRRLPADTTATVEDMLPSVTTVTANSDTITETFATAQNSPTSETTTLTSSIAPPVTATPDSNSVPAGQATPSKGTGVTAASPAPAPAPKVAPLVDLSDPPTSAPAASNLSSSVLATQGAVLSPSAPASAGEAPQAPPASKAVSPSGASPLAAAPTAPAPEAPQAKQEAPGTKGPDPEPTQPGASKSPPEAARALASPKSEAASVSTTNPAQGEDFKMDEGNFKTPDIDLAKDVFAALGSPAPAAGASGQASELAPSTADGSLPPAPAKTEYGLSLSAVVGWCPVVVCVCAVLCPP